MATPLEELAAIRKALEDMPSRLADILSSRERPGTGGNATRGARDWRGRYTKAGQQPSALKAATDLASAGGGIIPGLGRAANAMRMAGGAFDAAMALKKAFATKRKPPIPVLQPLPPEPPPNAKTTDWKDTVEARHGEPIPFAKGEPPEPPIPLSRQMPAPYEMASDKPPAIGTPEFYQHRTPRGGRKKNPNRGGPYARPRPGSQQPAINLGKGRTKRPAYSPRPGAENIPGTREYHEAMADARGLLPEHSPEPWENAQNNTPISLGNEPPSPSLGVGSNENGLTSDETISLLEDIRAELRKQNQKGDKGDRADAAQKQNGEKAIGDMTKGEMVAGALGYAVEGLAGSDAAKWVEAATSVLVALV